jgi:hypothetical protein|tara:strand:- start:50253 stop:50684 length:432 start_codon:yes stop_codon:yes gene_type:complete
MGNKKLNDEEDPIGEALDILPPIKQEKEEPQDLVTEDGDTSVTDFVSARQNIHDMINASKEAIDLLAGFAERSQQPRAFEVLGKLIETNVKANKDLLELQEKIRQIKELDITPEGKAKTINNNLFVGSTTELQKILKNMKNEE